MVYLEIGPGKKRIGPDWITVNCVPGAERADHIVSWGYERLPFDDESVDLIYASHVLEHIPWYRTIDALREAYRVLASGGRIEILVPDFAQIVAAYLENRMVDSWAKHNPKHDYMLSVAGRIFTYEPDMHKAIFDYRHLKNCLLEAGFRNVTPNCPVRGYDHGVISLKATGEKISHRRDKP